jgi:hypothetical protein
MDGKLNNDRRGIVNIAAYSAPIAAEVISIRQVWRWRSNLGFGAFSASGKLTDQIFTAL